MRIDVYNSENVPEEVCRIVSTILFDAFEERRIQGINFKCGHFTPEDVKKEMKDNSFLFLAYTEDNIPVGTAMLKIRSKYGLKYGGYENLAVRSQYKGKGVAKLLFNERFKKAQSLDLDFLTSTTATQAFSSVQYHKKMGFIIYKKSYNRRMYNSYNYIYPLKRLKLLNVGLFRSIVYCLNTLIGIIR